MEGKLILVSNLFDTSQNLLALRNSRKIFEMLYRLNYVFISVNFRISRSWNALPVDIICVDLNNLNLNLKKLILIYLVMFFILVLSQFV